MTEITTQRTGEFTRKLFEILINHIEGMRARDALKTLQEQVQLTEYERGKYPSGGLRFEKIVRFATIDYVKAGWLVKDKGRWTVTSEGKHAYNEYNSPEEFYRNARKLYGEWRKSRPEPDTKVEEAQEWAWDEIEDYLQTMPPYELQKLIASLLKAMGYHISWIAPPGKDGGVDIMAWNDPLGTRPPRIRVQVKREQHSVNVANLRSFMALLGGDDVGIFVSTGGFTKDAEEEARTQQNRQVTLINLERLYELWVEHLDKLDQEARDLFPLKPIYFLAPEG